MRARWICLQLAHFSNSIIHIIWPKVLVHLQVMPIRKHIPSPADFASAFKSKQNSTGAKGMSWQDLWRDSYLQTIKNKCIQCLTAFERDNTLVSECIQRFSIPAQICIKLLIKSLSVLFICCGTNSSIFHYRYTFLPQLYISTVFWSERSNLLISLILADSDQINNSHLINLSISVAGLKGC